MNTQFFTVTSLCAVLALLLIPFAVRAQGLVIKMKDGTITYIPERDIEECIYTHSVSDTPEQALEKSRIQMRKTMIRDDTLQIKMRLPSFLEKNGKTLPNKLAEIVSFEGMAYPLSLQVPQFLWGLGRQEGDEKNRDLIEQRFILLMPGEPAPSAELGLKSTREDHQRAAKVFVLISNPDFVDGKFAWAINGVGQAFQFKDYTKIPGIDKHLDLVNKHLIEAWEIDSDSTATATDKESE